MSFLAVVGRLGLIAQRLTVCQLLNNWVVGGSRANGPDGGPPAWVFRLHGRLLEPSGVPQKGVPPAPEPFSHYLRSVRWAKCGVALCRARPVPGEVGDSCDGLSCPWKVSILVP